MSETEMQKLKNDMDSQVVELINTFELATGYTVVDFKINRVCESDWRSAVTRANSFVFFSIPNRKV
jgi:hypothetical protein